MEEMKIHRSSFNAKMLELNMQMGQVFGRLDSNQDWAKEFTDKVEAELECVKRLKSRVVSVEEKFTKIDKCEHKWGDLQRVKKEAELRDKKITAVCEGLKELKTVHKKELEEESNKNRERLAELQTSFEAKVREAANQALEKATVKSMKSAENKIFFTGLPQIWKRENLNGGDITSVVHNVLHRVGSSLYYTNVIAIYPKNSPRNSAENVIVYFQLTYKNFAAAEIWRFLAKEGIKGTGVRDLFLPKFIATSRNLTAKGFELKKRGLVHKFCVDNISEIPTMFIAKRGGTYAKVTNIQVAEMLKQDVMDMS